MKEAYSKIYFKCKAVKEDSKALTMNKVGPANLLLQALMSFSKATLQNKSTITRNYNPYQAYIQTLINSGQDTLSNKTLGVTNHSGSNNRLFMMLT